VSELLVCSAYNGRCVLPNSQPIPSAIATAVYGLFSIVWRTMSSNDDAVVVDKDEAHALVFVCRQIPGGWINAESKKRIDVRPTHWREWVEKP